MSLLGDLRKVLLVSLLAHLGASLLFGVQLRSSLRFPSYDSCQISFLGSLLDERLLKVTSSETMKTRKITEEPNWDELIEPAASFPDHVQPRDMTVPLPTPIVSLYPNNSKPLLVMSPKPSSVELEGDLQARTVLYQPDLPVFPAGFTEHLSIFEVAFRFQVSREGVVQQVERIVSSGYPEVDVLATRYLRSWRFAPQNLKRQNGVLRIYFNPERPS